MDGRLYRAAWLVVALPLVIVAFTVTRPSALPRPSLPPTFDAGAAAAIADDLATTAGCGCPYRTPSSPGDLASADWFRSQMEPFGLHTSVDRFAATVPGVGRVTLRNVTAVVPGRSPQIILVMAHRDNVGGLVVRRDNASGTAALIEIARAYTAGPGGARVTPEHTILFLSTDGGAYGGLGAAHFARHAAEAKRVLAVVSLDTIATSGRPRVELGGPGPHSPSPTLLASAAARIADQTGSAPGRTSVLGQLVDLAFPFSLYEQWPFLGRRVSAITITTAGDRPSSDGGPLGRLDSVRLGQVGRAAQALVSSLDQGLDLSQGTGSYLYVGSRIVRGWTIALVLVALAVPFLAAVVDLFARCRRLRIRLGPAFRAYRRRLLFWLWVGALFELFALLGAWPGGAEAPLDPGSTAAGRWPLPALTGFVLLAGASWLVSRTRLAPVQPCTREEELAGLVAPLLVLGLVALLVIAANVYALLFLLPSLHAWLWLPQTRGRPGPVRAALYALGLAGPALLLGSFAVRFGLGFDAPWYLAELTAIGYVPIVAVVLALGWTAAAAQLLAVTAGRYAPYAGAAQGAPPGLVRTLVRSLVLGLRARRRASLAQSRPEG
ncbi:MAG TPA: M28 family peptidase [Gaiellaceae bacterium]|nr:M28 family peptidase [Gaiellaceae bacterium]